MAEKILIASGKGGAGKTSLTAGLALSLARKGKSVLVIDFDIAQGCIEYILGASDSSVYNWGDAVLGQCRTGEVLNLFGAVSYITAPKQTDDRFTQENVKNFVDSFDGSFDYILFDSPAGVTGGFLLAAKCADRALIVSTPDEVCVRTAAKASDVLFENGIKDVRLVINRFNKNATVNGRFLNIDEMIDAVSLQLIGVVPEDKKITYASSTGFSSLPECPAKAAYMRIADRIIGNKSDLVLKRTKKERPKKFNPLILIICILAAAVIALGTLFTVDFVKCGSLQSPVFTKSVRTDTNKEYLKGFCYTAEIIRDKNGKIVSSEMKIGSKTVSAAIADGE